MLFEESINAIVGGHGERAVAAGHAQARHRRLLEGPARPVARGTVRRRARDQPPHHPRALVPPRRSERTTGTRDRSKACVVFVDLGDRRGARGRRTTASYRFRPTRARTSPRTTRRPRVGLRPLDIVQPDGPSFTVDGHAITLATLVDCGCRWTRTKGSCCTPSATRTAAVCGPILHRAVGERDGRPVRRPRSVARMEERVRRGRVGARPHGQLARARLRLPRRDPLPRRGLRGRARQAVDVKQRHLHPRRGLRDPLEALGHASRTPPRSADRAGSWSVRSRRSATTSTASTGTSTSTARCSSR